MFYYLILAIVFLISVMVGSFLNVVILRFDSKTKFWQGRSKCMTCNHVLEWYDLVPLLSFLSIGAKCRYCRTKLSWQYPLVELGTGILSTLAFYFIFPDISSLFDITKLEIIRISILWFLVSQLVIIFVYDLKYMLIPNISLRLLQLAGLLWLITESISEKQLYTGLYSGLILAFLIFLIYFFTKKQGMGFGDIDLILGLGFFLPIGVVGHFFFGSFIVGTFWGIILIIINRKINLKIKMPFGPSIILAFIVIMGAKPYWQSMSEYWEAINYIFIQN